MRYPKLRQACGRKRVLYVPDQRLMQRKLGLRSIKCVVLCTVPDIYAEETEFQTIHRCSEGLKSTSPVVLGTMADLSRSFPPASGDRYLQAIGEQLPPMRTGIFQGLR